MATAPALNQTTNGTIAQVIGAVVDVTFEGKAVGRVLEQPLKKAKRD